MWGKPPTREKGLFGGLSIAACTARSSASAASLPSTCGR
jgi:hypothetical protein